MAEKPPETNCNSKDYQSAERNLPEIILAEKFVRFRRGRKRRSTSDRKMEENDETLMNS